MKRLIGVKELRALLESNKSIYEIMDDLNTRARVYAIEEGIQVLRNQSGSAEKQRAEYIARQSSTNPPRYGTKQTY
tara:strand:- start:18925 stop:19152 length:228 start_codon:yes stop_codon:yes gene_type:complete